MVANLHRSSGHHPVVSRAVIGEPVHREDAK